MAAAAAARNQRLEASQTAHETAAPERRDMVSGRASWFAALDRFAPVGLAALVIGYFLLFTAMSLYWRDHLRWGFDITVYSQPIWNTAHGRLWEVSLYDWTATELGHDLVLIELPLAPLYRLLGGNIALVLVQSATIALGGWGAYAVARHALPRINRVIPLLFAVLYLSLLFIHATNLEKFHARNLIMCTFFFAWLGYRTNRTWLIWLMLGIALTARSDVALVVFAFGLFCLLERRRWTQSWLPMAVGAAWFFGVVYVLVPHFSTVGFVYDQNYGWLGGSISGIIKASVTRPLYVLRGVVTADKLRYTFDLLFPFAFLPLLKPKMLLIPLPIYLLNVLSNYPHQFSITAHYQSLIVPWLMIAAIEAAADIAQGRGRIGARLLPGIAAMMRQQAGSVRAPTAIATTLVVVMLGCSAIQQLTIASPVLSYVFHHEPSARADAGRALIAQVPHDAPLAITQKLAGNTPDRRYVYSFPGDPLYHSPALVDRADYLIGDKQLSDFEQQSIARYRADPAWQVVDERGGFVLMRRVQPLRKT